MGLAHSPKLPQISNVVLCVDMQNKKTWPGSGSTLYDAMGKETIAGSGLSVSTITKSIEHSTTLPTWNMSSSSGAYTCDFNTAVNHEVWSINLWVRKEGTLGSDYRSVVYLRDSALATYFYTIDTRQTINSYLLGYQKDEAISSWLSHNFGTNQTTYFSGDWFMITTVHNNGVFKTYRNGSLISTQTQTLNVGTYGDIDRVILNNSSSNNCCLGSFHMWDSILSDTDVLNVYNATRWKHGLETVGYSP